MPSSKLSALLATVSLFLIPATVNLEVPLYPTYAKLAHVGAGVTSLTQLGYFLGALPVLILLGGLSQELGSRKVLMLALFIATFSTLIMMLWPTLDALFVARFLHGIGVAFGLSAGATFLSENEPEKHLHNSTASLVSVSTSLGFGAGALSTTLLLQAEPSLQPQLIPLSLPVGAAATGLTFFALCCVPLLRRQNHSVPLQRSPDIQPGQPSQPSQLGQHGKWRRLVRLPAFPPGAFFCGLIIAASWAVSGVVIAVVPGALANHQLENISGITLFCVNATGALIYPFIRNAQKWPVAKLLRTGLLVLAAGGFALTTGVTTGFVPLILGGAILCGAASYGFCYLGSLARLDAVSGHEKARALAGYFLMAYLGFCIPSIAIGFAADLLGMNVALWSFAGMLALACVFLASRISLLSPKKDG